MHKTTLIGWWQTRNGPHESSLTSLLIWWFCGYMYMTKDLVRYMYSSHERERESYAWLCFILLFHYNHHYRYHHYHYYHYWCAILIAHQIVMAKHGGSCVHFSGISTCGRTSRETVSHPQCPPLPTLCKISLPIYVIVTNKLLQPLTTTWYDSLVLSISLLKI